MPTTTRRCGNDNGSVTQQYIFFAGTFEEAWHSRLKIGSFYVLIIVAIISSFGFWLGKAGESNNHLNYEAFVRLLGGLIFLLGGAWRFSLIFWSTCQEGRLTVIKKMEYLYDHLYCLYTSEDQEYEGLSWGNPYEMLVRTERFLGYISMTGGIALLCFAHLIVPLFIKQS